MAVPGLSQSSRFSAPLAPSGNAVRMALTSTAADTAVKSERPSATAQVAAVMRGLTDHRSQQLVYDRYVPDMLPKPVGQALNGIGKPVVNLIDRGRQVLGQPPAPNHIIMRTRAIDDALIEAVSGGARQVVLLGAGLDTRANRMDSLAQATVYEVDRPATQQNKRQHVTAAGLRPACKAVRYLPIDLAQDDLLHALREAGFSNKKPAVFILEGLSMYLSPADLDGLLTALARCSGKGSRILMTYADDTNPVAHVVGTVTGWVGEPFRSFSCPAEMAARLRNHGFDVQSDTSDHDWAQQYGVTEPSSIERLVCAVKRR